ncbi:MAG TPA: hypothetical protein K8V15_09835 [Tessaracoccus flavescens]|uniref:Tetracyclin repressor-like C-terminal group 31 domain-containing protein n=1 Tax=Tessaracoccus flavescens TaxID=399497 RepID=A0A921JS65_9ACTN|nr:hypothetical protein [Tessaracoccus flavescens]
MIVGWRRVIGHLLTVETRPHERAPTTVIRRIGDDDGRGPIHGDERLHGFERAEVIVVGEDELVGLRAHQIREGTPTEIGAVMTVTPEQQADAAATGTIPAEVWAAAEATWRAVTSRPELVRARFELYLHAGRNPGLQAAIRRGRERFIDATAASLPSANPRAGAQMVLALATGMMLHHISAPDPELDRLAPTLLLATSAAALTFPLSPPPGA